MKNGAGPRLVVAVPVKDLTRAKQRLTSVLSVAERGELAGAMLRDVLRALAAADLERVWVVTCDPAAAAIARSLGAEPVSETVNRGHTAAVALAQAEAARRGARVFLTVPGDVPCVTADELRQIVGGVREGAPVFVPSRSGLGTNGVALAPADAMPLTFGEPSFARHLETARAHGLTPRVLALPGLGLDVDAPEDLTALLAEPSATETRRLVSTWRARGGLTQISASGP
ncbi:MAG: 2-phospho-L-lactate guanylyltransferase [Candidatus Rokuibacteriota bacterium]|nr:MAG: 2-phospho-L-lactate guanylyltransferase [Candidatus Rokubacteria bacterium]